MGSKSNKFEGKNRVMKLIKGRDLFIYLFRSFQQVSLQTFSFSVDSFDEADQMFVYFLPSFPAIIKLFIYPFIFLLNTKNTKPKPQIH